MFRCNTSIIERTLGDFTENVGLGEFFRADNDWVRMRRNNCREKKQKW